MPDQDFIQTIRLNEIFMPAASRERRDMFERQGLEFSPHALGVQFAHYTSADAAMKIIRSKRIWTRNAKCMSDYSEVTHGYDLLKQYFDVRANTEEFVRVFDAIAPGAARQAFDTFNGWWRERHLGLNIFVASLTEHDAIKENKFGRLSMWRGFGSASDTRVALVLKVAAHSQATTALSLFFGPVVYAKTEDLAAEMRQVLDNVTRETAFLKSIDPEQIYHYLFAMIFSGVTSTKHPAFREEREWRAVHSPDIFPSTLMEKSVEVISGVPQHVYKVPLDKNVSDQVAQLDVADIIDRVLIGPSPYPWPLYQAFVDVLRDAGVSNPDERVIVSGIPLRT